MNNCVNAIVVLFVLWGGIASGQDLVLPQPITYCWPVTIPIYDTAIHLDRMAFIKNKVKFYCIYDDEGNLMSQTFLDRKGLNYLVLINDDSGSVEREYQMNYDSFGQVIVSRRIEYDPNKYIEILPRLILSEYTIQYENKNGIPWKMFAKNDTNERSTYGEAVYENGILIAVKRVRINNPDKFSICQVGHIGDTLTMCGTDINTRLVQIISKKDTVILSGIDMWPTYTIVKDKKLIYFGDNSSYTKYYYKENGLVDFTISKSQSSSIEKTNFYRYSYYED